MGIRCICLPKRPNEDMVKLLLLLLWMGVIPMLIGLLFTGLFQLNTTISPVLAFPAGSIVMWAIFQAVSVPLILRSANFAQVLGICNVLYLILCVLSLLMLLIRRKAAGDAFKAYLSSLKELPVWTYLLWIAAFAGIAFQLYQAYTLAYADGDDAYYVSVSTAAGLGGSMYYVDAYTGIPTSLDVRHALAPFPILITYLAKNVHVEPAVMAHSMAPLMLLLMTYALYLCLGKVLCGRHRAALPLFLLVAELLQVFGNYSIYPASTFLLTRTAQGKSVLGNVILPFFFLLFLLIAQRVAPIGHAAQSGDEISKELSGERSGRPLPRTYAAIFWLMVTLVAGMLCSTLAVFLCSLLIGIGATLLAICKRSVGILAAALISILPAIAYAGLYFWLV